jgi:DNA-binding GntR family transcriptional regulator
MTVVAGSNALEHNLLMAAAVERAYFAIREGIVSGVYRPGAHLTAQGLAATSGISRTPVREAMRRLHSEGLIQLIPRRGAFVTHLDERDVFRIYDLRVVLEGFAAETAASEATVSQIEGLEALTVEMTQAIEEAPSPDVDRVTQINTAFHKLVFAAADNARLEAALASIVEVPLQLRTFRRYGPAEFRRSVNQHIELIEALKARDGIWARSVMVGHILAGRNALLRGLETQED